MEQRIYTGPFGAMTWCQKCGACLEALSKRGILAKLHRHVCQRKAAA